MVPSKYYIYDLETLVNFFSFTGKFLGSDSYFAFEISPRKNERNNLLEHLNYLKQHDVIMVGYNSLGFDYPILHELLSQPYTFTHDTAYKLCQEIIGSQSYGDAGRRSIQYSNRFIRQLDLVKLNHFDNDNRRVSLKSLQVAMRSESIEDLPVEIGVPLTQEQMVMTLSYNLHDVTETEKFLVKCMHMIEMREKLEELGVIKGDILNYSDVKIGREYLINKIGRNKCFDKGKPIQTVRTSINIANLILPKIRFRDDVLNEEVLEWFRQVDVKERPHKELDYKGVKYKFGLGGLHGSVNNKIYRSNKEFVIKDVDVSGMYVAVAVANGFHPAHLGEDFVRAYSGLKAERSQYEKGTPMNALLKLSGNGVYGDSNNPYSPFYDPAYTYRVTVNGQLQVMQLVEMLSLIPRVEIIQANTDGVTVYLPRELEHLFNMWCEEWERETLLNLEHVDYEGMWIADVNSYIARDVKGKVKRKGRYWYPESEKEYHGNWAKDFSAMIVPKLASEYLLNDHQPESLIRLMFNPYDFTLAYKTPRGAKLYVGDEAQQRTLRYYVSTNGETLKKVAKPKGKIGEYKRKNKLTDNYFYRISKEIGEGVWDERIHTKNKSVYKEVVTSIESGFKIKPCNKIEDFNWQDLNYDYYLEEIRKLYI